MKQFIAFVRKEFYHIFRDKRTLLVLFGMPAAQLLLFGFAITTEVNNANIGIYNQSLGQFSSELVEKVVGGDFFRLAANMKSEDDMLEAFQTNQVKLILVIPPKFEQDFANGNAKIQLIADGSDPNLASILTSSAEAIIGGWVRSKNRQNLQIETISPEVRWHYNPELKSAQTFVPGVVTIILMLVSAMLTSISITREKELGTIEILYVSPLKPALIIVGKVLPFAILGFINAILILIMAWLVFSVPVNGSVDSATGRNAAFHHHIVGPGCAHFNHRQHATNRINALSFCLDDAHNSAIRLHLPYRQHAFAFAHH
jgi:ABC-2 type transport system permease protein